MRGLRLLLALSSVAVMAQTPVLAPSVNPRGVVNAFSLQPAPSRVAQGGVIYINGLNLGPPEGVKATGTPLPTRLAEPEIEVLINGQAAPLFSANPSRIVAQVPWETPVGLATIVVKRGELRSRPARIFVEPLVPSVPTREERGFGEISATSAGGKIAVRASGLGVTEPRVASGEAGPADVPATPRQNVRAYVNGLPAQATAAASSERVGEFDVTIEALAVSEPGDVIELIVGNQPANRTTLGSIALPQVQFLPLPEGAPELRSVSDSDLRGNYAVASAARDDNGCYASFLADFARGVFTPVSGCLTSANRNAASPVVTPAGSPALAALAGPLEGEGSNLSSKVVLFNPSTTGAMNVELPAGAANLAAGAGGNINALVPGDPPRTLAIDIQSGEVAELQPQAQAAQPGAAVLNVANLEIDVDGLKVILARPAQFGPNSWVVVVGDDAQKPSRSKLAILNTRGDVLSSYDFPAGYLPLIPPAPQAAGPAPAPGTPTTPPRPGTPTQPPPGTPAQPTQPVQTGQRLALPVIADPQSRSFFVLAAGESTHALLWFLGTELEWRVLPFPEGWYATACTANITLFNLDLSRRVALLGSRTAETAVKNPCPSDGFLLLDRETQRITATPLPGQGQLNATTSRDLNDYVFGSNTDPANRGQADTLYVFDGVSAALFRIDLPQGAASFGTLTAIPSINALVGPATNRTPGDAGVVLFELDKETSRLLPIPGDFTAVTVVGVFETTRKLVARGTKAAGSQFIVYDLTADDLAIVPNPEGVAFVGQAPVVAATPTEPRPTAPVPLILNVNLRSNFITTIGYNAERRQVGLIAVKVP